MQADALVLLLLGQAGLRSGRAPSHGVNGFRALHGRMNPAEELILMFFILL